MRERLDQASMSSRTWRECSLASSETLGFLSAALWPLYMRYVSRNERVYDELKKCNIPDDVAGVLLAAGLGRVGLWNLAGTLDIVKNLAGVLLGLLRGVGVLRECRVSGKTYEMTMKLKFFLKKKNIQRVWPCSRRRRFRG
jgi:hypothetical protein